VYKTKEKCRRAAPHTEKSDKACTVNTMYNPRRIAVMYTKRCGKSKRYSENVDDEIYAQAFGRGPQRGR
jgi:hypothetical protein